MDDNKKARKSMFAIVNDDLNIKDAGHKEKGANED